MALTHVIKYQEITYTTDAAVNILLAKLNEAIDDIENGKVQTIDEAWDEIDTI